MSGGDGGAALVITAAAVRRTIALLVALVLIGAVIYVGRGLIGRPPATADQIDRGAYQVVFMSTGQAFYGKLTIADAETFLMADVYYLVTNETGQPGRLVKRGAEVFGPREPMVILARQVLFFENLRDDSELMNGIRALKAGQGTAPGGPAATPASTPSARPSASR